MVYSSNLNCEWPNMQGLNLKYGKRKNDWRCFYCCHVRLATISLGIWHLMLHVLALMVIAVVVRNPNLLLEQEESSTATPHTPPYPADYINYEELNLGVVIAFCTFIITFLMVYGAIKGKPAYLMPFFCLQVFDFCISSLSVLRWLCYLPDMHRLIETNKEVLPFPSELLHLSPQALSIMLLLVFTGIMLFKGYSISIVWSCYKYLTLRSLAGQRTVLMMEPQQHGLLTEQGPQPTTTYHKSSTPPPSYDDAMANYAPNQVP